MKLSPVPPGPKGHFLVGSLPEIQRDELDFLMRQVREHGDVVHLRVRNGFPRPRISATAGPSNGWMKSSWESSAANALAAMAIRLMSCPSYCAIATVTARG